MGMTNAQKAALAGLIIRGAVDSINAFKADPESFLEIDLLEDIEDEELYTQAGKWLMKLPGTVWDTRLGEVK